MPGAPSAPAGGRAGRDRASYIEVMTLPHAPCIVALGDSLTAGYGLLPAASFANRLQAMMQPHAPGAVVHNAGLSGDTTEGGLRRLPRVLMALPRKPDLAIVELGANDLLRGVLPAQVRANLDAILIELGRCDIPALLATFDPPRFLHGPYGGIYADLVARHRVRAAPFFPPGVLGHPELVLPDGIHPNARAIEMVAKAFLPALLAALGLDTPLAP